MGRPRKTPATTDFEHGLIAAVPSMQRDKILALFGHRASWSSIWDWRNGRRGVPQWALDRLQEGIGVTAAKVASIPPSKGCATNGMALQQWRAAGRPTKEKASD